MPVVEMPNGDQVSFPDNMPAEQIKSLIATKFPDAVKAAQPESKGTVRGTILPLERNLDTGERSWAVPGFLQGLFDSGTAAVTAPGRAMSGELRMTDDTGRTSPEAIAEAGNMALWASPTSIATGTGKELAKQAGVNAGNDVLEAASARLMRKTTPEMADRALGSERNQLLQAAGRLGVDLPVAAASDRASVQQLGKVVSNVPLMGQPVRKASQQAIRQLDDVATKAQSELGAGNVQVAGNAAREGITDYAKNTLGDAVKAKYDAVDQLVTQNVTSPLQKTTAVATDIMGKRTNAQIPGQSGAVRLVQQAMEREGGLNYKGVKDLRTYVGEMLDNPSLIPADTSQAELKQIYGALSEDLKSAVLNAGGQKALSEFEKANSFAAKVAEERKTLNSVLGTKSDEAVFDKIVSMAGSTSRADISTLYKVKKAVSGDTWNEISSAAISRIGRDKEGNFTPDRFITEYGKLSQAGKTALFKGNGNEGLSQSLDDIAKVSSRFKQLNQYANPSGTAQSVIGSSFGAGAIMSPLAAVKVAIPAYVTARILARPASAKVAADYAKAYEAAARAPGKTSSQYLTRKAQELALIAANDMGNPGLANGLAGKLLLQQKAAADEENNVGVGKDESQQQPGAEDNGAGPTGNYSGLITAGNIDLAKRPVVNLPDGSIATVRSMSFENSKGQEVLVPTVSPDGRILTNHEAMDLYRRTGKHLGIFDNPEDADAYAEALHQAQDKFYSGRSKREFNDAYLRGEAL